MPKISTLGQKLWPTGREQTDTQTHRQRKQTLRTPFFEKKVFDFLFGPIIYIQNFKSLFNLVRSTDSVEINRGYITKNSKNLKIALNSAKKEKNLEK